MPDSAVLTHDEILDEVREVLIEALVRDAEEVTPEASLTADLQAESIDFLDIVFRLEKAFSSEDKPFKIEHVLAQRVEQGAVDLLAVRGHLHVDQV